MIFEIDFFGHENIRSNHARTIEITKEKNLTPSGDCIIGVGASAACNDLPDKLKAVLRSPGSTVLLTFRVGGYEFTARGRGHEGLALSHKHDIVIRKSSFVCPRTMAVQCDKASDLIPRKMVRLLQNPETRGTLTIEVDCDNFI